MRIASWNVNSVRTRLPHICDWLQHEQPEVLCLQETKVADELFPHAAFNTLGYEAVISGQKAYNGVAILSRLPLEDVQRGFPSLLPQDGEATTLAEQKRLISARIEGLRVLNLYVPNGASLKSEKYTYKLAWLACLRRYLEAQAALGEPLVMVGDFNIAPEDRDLPDPERLRGGIMASEAERQALRRLTGDQLVDAFRLFEPAAGHWSWWDYRSGAWEQDRGWRIDQIWLDPCLQDWATGCVIHKDQRAREQPSDHAPVVVHLAWPPPENSEDGETEAPWDSADWADD
ncbi:MAG: exodeoxyribonuclease III [Synechococcaceae cyanobacterium]|nr:exodeoxyribonuclease III [Synechococcaceae cyanobacterium]